MGCAACGGGAEQLPQAQGRWRTFPPPAPWRALPVLPAPGPAGRPGHGPTPRALWPGPGLSPQEAGLGDPSHTTEAGRRGGCRRAQPTLQREAGRLAPAGSRMKLICEQEKQQETQKPCFCGRVRAAGSGGWVTAKEPQPEDKPREGPGPGAGKGPGGSLEVPEPLQNLTVKDPSYQVLHVLTGKREHASLSDHLCSRHPGAICTSIQVYKHPHVRTHTMQT